MMLGQAGVNTTDAYTGPDGNGDGSSDGVGSVAGMAAIGIAGAGSVAAGYALANGKSKRVERAYEAGKHAVQRKVFGHIEGLDNKGKGGVHYTQQNWEALEKNGMASNNDGKWELTEDREKAKNFVKTQPSSASGTLNQRYTSNPTTPTPAPTKNAVNMETPSNSDTDSITQNKQKPTLSKKSSSPLITEDIGSDDSVKNAQSNIEQMSDKKAGEMSTKHDLLQKKAGLDLSTEEGQSQKKNIDNVLAKIDNGADVYPGEINKALGENRQHPTKTIQTQRGDKTKTSHPVDFEKMGANEKASAIQQS